MAAALCPLPDGCRKHARMAPAVSIFASEDARQ